MIKEQITEIFVNFLENPLVYVNLVQELMKIIEDFASKEIREKTQQLLRTLHLEDQESIVFKQFLNFFQDFHQKIFVLNSEKLTEIRENYREKAIKILEFRYISFETNASSQENESFFEKFATNEEIEQLFANEELNKLISAYFSLCLHMSLHEPPLKTSVEAFESRTFTYVSYKKSEYYCIDGFVKENAPAIVVVPPVMRMNFTYNGIKPAVLIISKEIIGKKEFEKVLEKLQGSNKCKGSGKGDNSEIEDENRERNESIKKENKEVVKENKENFMVEGINENFKKNQGNKEDFKEMTLSEVEKHEKKEDLKKIGQINNELTEIRENKGDIENNENLAIIREKNTKNSENQESCSKKQEFIEEKNKNEISFELLAKDLPVNFNEITINNDNNYNYNLKENTTPLEPTKPCVLPGFNEKDQNNFLKNETFSRNFDIFSKKMMNSKKAKTLN